MEFNRIDIINFRSIESETICFDPKCRVLVGINESGKSNILMALSLLDEDTPPTSGDVRESLPEEPEIHDSFVRFVFVLNDVDSNNKCNYQY